MAATTIISEDNTTDQTTPLLESVYAHIATFRLILQGRAVCDISDACTGVIGYTVGSEGPVRGCICLR